MDFMLDFHLNNIELDWCNKLLLMVVVCKYMLVPICIKIHGLYVTVCKDEFIGFGLEGQLFSGISISFVAKHGGCNQMFSGVHVYYLLVKLPSYNIDKSPPNDFAHPNNISSALAQI